MWRLALLGLSAALLAGCGASDPVAAEEVSAAVSKTASADSFRIEIEGDEGDETVIMRGVAEQDRRRASFVYDLTSNEAGVESQHGKLVIVGNTMYMDSSLFGLSTDQTRKAMPKPWFKVENFNSEVTLDTLMFPFPFVAPGRILAAFEKVSGDVESLGEETVRGVPTSRYKLTLDLARLIETAPAEDRAALREELEDRKTKTEPVEISIDEAGLARRVRFVADSDAVSIDFFDFGIAADVKEPPADQVEDFDALLGGQLESGEMHEFGTDYEEAP